MRVGSLIIASVLFMSAAWAVQADRIGINFYDGAAATPATLAPTDTAGQADVAQSNWNNFTITSDDANGQHNSGVLSDPVDHAGNTVTGMTITVDAAPGTKVWPTLGAAWGFTGADLTLRQGQFHPQPRITITHIPYARYDIYIYANAGNQNGGGKATLSVAEGGSGVVDLIDTYWYNNKWQSGNYVQATNTDGVDIPGSNYIRWTGNTTRDITIDWDGKVGGGGWTGTTGIQIVDVVPEPTTALGWVAAGLVFTTCRRG